MIEIPVSPGELLDKISILEIKQSRLKSDEQLTHVQHELDMLNRVRSENLETKSPLTTLMEELKRINLELWEIEDDIRLREREEDFGETFVALARAVYIKNDARSAVKRRINDLLESPIVEEKSYTEYWKESSSGEDRQAE